MNMLVLYCQFNDEEWNTKDFSSKASYTSATFIEKTYPTSIFTNIFTFLGINAFVNTIDVIFGEVLKSWAAQNILSDEVSSILQNQEVSIIIKKQDQIDYCNRKG